MTKETDSSNTVQSLSIHAQGVSINDQDLVAKKPLIAGPSPCSHHGLSHLINNNRSWAKNIRSQNPEYFEQQFLGQSPKVLWLGCSDSRVPENNLLQMGPGEIFTHRNIANVIVQSDLSAMSVVQYAVEVLKVEHVIVCGHYGCGGVAAALGDHSYGSLDLWLSNIKNVKDQHIQTLNAIKGETDKCRALVELNVRQSLMNLAKSPSLKRAWAAGSKVEIHGWVYDIQTGLVSELGYDLGACNEQELNNAFVTSSAIAVV